MKRMYQGERPPALKCHAARDDAAKHIMALGTFFLINLSQVHPASIVAFEPTWNSSK